ncbi:GNAT family N-acetyltransferase [Catellatospora sp. NPDC049609]|uniref:GNAT family N-acetyltransferase n=1 Tax=Catellatospora sp. NPDC049609 TaxID=3155505 RepID=UPI0034397C92
MSHEELSARDVFARITAFQQAAVRRQAERVVDFGEGFTALCPSFPYSYDHNLVVLTGDDAPDDVVELVESVLDRTGVEHRLVLAHSAPLGDAVAAALTGAGYGHTVHVVMRLTASAGPIGDPGEVRELSLDELRPGERAMWQERLPDAPDEVLDQLADRRVLRRACAEEVVFLGVRDEDGAVVAQADLYLDRGFGCAQIEDVRTSPAHRGRGLARAVLAECVRRAAEAGCPVTFLVADAEDWPRRFYERIGFETVGHTHLFLRFPG